MTRFRTTASPDLSLFFGIFCLLTLSLNAPVGAAPGGNLLPPLTHMETCARDSDYGFMGAKNWQFALFGTAQATMVPEGDALKFIVAKADGTFWHSQIRYNADAVSGAAYEMRFRAKADAPRPLRLDSEFDDEKTKAYHETGLDWTCPLTAEWQTFARRFTAHDTVDGKCMLPSFSFGQKPGTIWLADVSLVRLPPGSSLTGPVSDAAAWGLDLWGKDAQGAYQTGLGPQVTMTPQGGAAKFVVTGQTRDSWSAYDAHATLKQGTAYTVSFRARAGAPRSLGIQGEKEPDGKITGPDGLDQKVDVTPQWQTYAVTFTTPPGAGGQNKLPEFIVGDADGPLWLSDVSLVEGAASVTAAVTTTPAARDAGAGPKPRAGEIKVTGTVMEVHAAAKSLLIAVTSVTAPDGTTTDLPAPRPKTILLSAQTLILTSDLTQKTLADLPAGANVSIIGKDSGAGKALKARTILLP